MNDGAAWTVRAVDGKDLETRFAICLALEVAGAGGHASLSRALSPNDARRLGADLLAAAVDADRKIEARQTFDRR